MAISGHTTVTPSRSNAKFLVNGSIDDGMSAVCLAVFNDEKIGPPGEPEAWAEVSKPENIDPGEHELAETAYVYWLSEKDDPVREGDTLTVSSEYVVSVRAVPEPGTAALLATGLLPVLAAARARRRRAWGPA